MQPAQAFLAVAAGRPLAPCNPPDGRQSLALYCPSLRMLA